MVVTCCLLSRTLRQGNTLGQMPIGTLGSTPQLGTNVPKPDPDLDPPCACTQVPAGEGGWQLSPGRGRKLAVKNLFRGGRTPALPKHKCKGRIIKNFKTTTEH